MASKPRNISSSPTNLSPSRVALRNAAGASAVGNSSSGRSSGGNGSKKGSSSPMATNAGRTPQTRRKELALQQQNSPTGSPKNSSSTVKKNSTTSRRNSLNNNGNNHSNYGRNSTTVNSNANNRRHRGRGLSASNLASTADSTADSKVDLKGHHNKNNHPVKLREETKFDGLWDVKTIENGLVRIPTQCLQDLITRDTIEKFYEVEDKPVAR